MMLIHLYQLSVIMSNKKDRVQLLEAYTVLSLRHVKDYLD